MGCRLVAVLFPMTRWPFPVLRCFQHACNMFRTLSIMLSGSEVHATFCIFIGSETVPVQSQYAITLRRKFSPLCFFMYFLLVFRFRSELICELFSLCSPFSSFLISPIYFPTNSTLFQLVGYSWADLQFVCTSVSSYEIPRATVTSVVSAFVVCLNRKFFGEPLSFWMYLFSSRSFTKHVIIGVATESI